MTIYPVPKPVRAKRPRAPLRNRKSMKRTKMRCGAGSKRRKGHAFPKNVDNARRDWIREQPCLATGKRTGQLVYFDPTWMPRTWLKASPWRCYVVCAHVKSRGSGGKDVANMVPLDSRIHDWQGVIGWPEFERRLQLLPRAEIAALYEKGYQVESGGSSTPQGAT